MPPHYGSEMAAYAFGYLMNGLKGKKPTPLRKAIIEDLCVRFHNEAANGVYAHFWESMQEHAAWIEASNEKIAKDIGAAREACQ